MKRALSTTNTLTLHRKKRIDLTPVIVNNRRYVNRSSIIPKCTETSNKIPVKPIDPVVLDGETPGEQENEITHYDNGSVVSSVNVNLARITSIM